MAKLTAWIVTILGVLLLLVPLKVISLSDPLLQWALAIGVLVIGVGKLARNYNNPPKTKKK